MAQYAQIADVIVQDRAAAGEVVEVTVYVKNLYQAPVSMGTLAVFLYGEHGQTVNFPVYTTNIGAGQTEAFAGSFAMPDAGGQLWVISIWYGADGQWHRDDEVYKDIQLEEAGFEFDIGTPVVSPA